MTAAFAIREGMNDIDEAPGKTWFWELERAVIDANRCIQCGACVAACPSDSLGIGPDDLPTLVKMCTGCSLCWDFCPRGGLRYEATWKLTGGDRAAGIERTRNRYSARTISRIPGAQDGGVVSALLIELLEAGELDGALLARPSEREPWKGEAFLARTADEVLSCAGSFYNQTMALAHLDLKKYDLPSSPRIAIVGTPCELQGLRAMQARPWYWGSSRVEAVVLTIGLLCTKSFNYEQLMVQEVQAKRGVALAEIEKIDIIRGKLYIYGRDEAIRIEEPIRNFHGAALKGCDECADFLGLAADISVGSVGSADGYSSVLVWTAAGQQAFDFARDRFDVRDLDTPAAIEKLDTLDKTVAFATLPRPFDPDAPLFIDYEEHLQHYAGSDRAPVEHDAVRY
ncbi:MAG: Coenzyme F420 hydrogenase/dehydrogenase, beta subunit C-terminal domain [Chloroflexota bacterium]|nr:Coenzyme F420 hydrogenase/dehydrogenase, beta subunit C-terminal domain [Chloroflexota bacterium]